MDVFNPDQHRLVAVDVNKDSRDYRQHVHVTLSELRRDLDDERALAPDELSAVLEAALPENDTIEFDGHTYAVPRDVGHLAMLVGLANAAIARDEPAGSARWLRESEDFGLRDIEGAFVVMDHETFLRFASHVVRF